MKERLKKIFDSKIGIVLYILIGIVVIYFRNLNPLFYLLVIIGVPLVYYAKRQSWLPYIFGGVVLAVLAHVALSLVLSNSFPLVAVVSGSMDHGINEFGYPCGKVQQGYKESFDNWWQLCGDTYSQFGIIKEQFQAFTYKDGFKVGDLPVIQGADKYAAGDIIVFNGNEAAPIIHRVVKINADGTYQTKGDHNAGQNSIQGKYDETSIKPAQIEGRVIFIIPKLGYFKVLTSGLRV